MSLAPNIARCGSDHRPQVLVKLRHLISLLILVWGFTFLGNITMAQNVSGTWAISIHGGAGTSPGNFSDEANAARHAAMQAALDIGQKILVDGGTSLDAVEAVIRFLEDEPQFNAGKGAVFNAQGRHELDASIMDGRDKSGGAVAGVTIVKNPISLARLVMTETRHVLLTGDGAEEFARSLHIDLVDNTYFDTPSTLKRWDEFLEGQKKDGGKDNEQAALMLDTGSYFGTVGCVALDSSGNLAAGTSTGGMTNKKFGRVGDSPILGAGTYADNESCAVSCTGIGEEFIRNSVAFDVSARMKYQGASVEQAVTDILENQLRPGDGGIIAVDKNGRVFMGFNTGGMARAMADSTGKSEVIWVEEK